MKTLICAVAIIFTTPLLGQPIRDLKPTSVLPLDISPEGEKKFEADRKAIADIQKKIDSGFAFDQLSQEEKDLYNNQDETIESYWDVIGGGCNWYCGGGPQEVTASSALPGQGGNSYAATNAHDLSYKTAWVEGVPGYGIGQYLQYRFAAESPRINEIIIVNGYVKSQSAWESNARASKLKMYYNDKPYAILNLVDQRAAQSFKIDPIGNSNRTDFDKLKTLPAWTLRFEIMEVYKGKKYDDVAITEIYFDGLDVHCFARGTKVTMWDGSLKNIEDIREGDEVVTVRPDDKMLTKALVQRIAKAEHHGLVRYVLQNGREIIATKDHPFFIHGKGWASLQPEGTLQYSGFDSVRRIDAGDDFEFAESGKIEVLALRSIEFLKGHFETYTISRLSSGNSFIANGFVVGTEALKEHSE